MALRGPSDYSEEPPRHPSLRINAKEPFNAEPARRDLVSAYITPVDLFFKRNHGPIPVLDDAGSYFVTIGGLVGGPRRLSLDDIRKLPKYNVTATLQCAGNRRTEMSKSRKVKGVGWDVCALGNATWGGAKLSDVLQLFGVPYHTEITPSGGKHVDFISVDQCPEEKGGPYKASIPLGQATNPAADVLVAYEMNGEVIKRDHGYPLRAIVPGVIGARSVKWLDKIDIIEEESQGFFMQKDYKMFPPSVDGILLCGQPGSLKWTTLFSQQYVLWKILTPSNQDRSLLLDMPCREVAGALRGLIYQRTVARVGLVRFGTKRKTSHMWLVTYPVISGHGCSSRQLSMWTVALRLLQKRLIPAQTCNLRPWNRYGILEGF